MAPPFIIQCEEKTRISLTHTLQEAPSNAIVNSSNYLHLVRDSVIKQLNTKTFRPEYVSVNAGFNFFASGRRVSNLRHSLLRNVESYFRKRNNLSEGQTLLWNAPTS